MAAVSLKCTCGAVHGQAIEIVPRSGFRVVCMCRDCQAFARYLGRQDELLDRNGGTDIHQLAPAQLPIRQGIDKIACLKLSPKGILRWYASCCRTPVCNTLSTPQVPFVGVPHLFMDHKHDGVTRDAALGPVAAYVHAQSGHGDISADAHQTVSWGLILSVLGRLVTQRIAGQHAPSPFFDAQSGKPICDPLGLTSTEREAL
jgi:hypothetical protein